MILKSISSSDNDIWLLTDEEVSVGRKDCRVLISNDSSISRLHAKLLARPDGTVFVTDLSKYGTTINKKKLTKNERYQLKEGDKVKFGNQPGTSEFILQHSSLVICCSGISGSAKADIKNHVKKLGAKLVEGWDTSCTHLVMNRITVTVKVVNALSSLKPIVTPQWITVTIGAVRSSSKLPDWTEYLPEVADENCDVDKTAFLPNDVRSYLLSGKVFYFLTEKQYQRLHECITNSGGICKLAAARTNVDALEDLTNNNAVVMAVDSAVLLSLDATQRAWVQEATDHVSSNGRRLIVDSEVGFALLHMSISQHCNPLSLLNPEPLPPPSLSQQVGLSQLSAGHDDHVGTSRTGGSMNVTVFASETEFGSEDQHADSSLSFRMLGTSGTSAAVAVIDGVKLEQLSADSQPLLQNSCTGEDQGAATKPATQTEPEKHLSTSSKTSETPRIALRANTTLTAPKTDSPSVFSSMNSSQNPKAVSALVISSTAPASSTVVATASATKPNFTTEVSASASMDESVLVPGTFSTPNPPEAKDVKLLSEFFSTRKKRRHDNDDVVDLTQEKPDGDAEEGKSPSVAAATGLTTTKSPAVKTSIFEVLSKRRRLGIGNDSKSATSPKISYTATMIDLTTTASTATVATTPKATPSRMTAGLAAASLSTSPASIVASQRESATGANSSSHGLLLSGKNQMFHESDLDQMDNSSGGSQRPLLTRFSRFAKKKTNGFISARNRSATEPMADGAMDVDSQKSETGKDEELPVAPPPPCEIISLMVVRNGARVRTDDTADAPSMPIVNFKKFKKAKYKGMGRLPTIIGESDLITFAEESSTLTQEWLEAREFEQARQPDANEDPDPFKLPNGR